MYEILSVVRIIESFTVSSQKICDFGIHICSSIKFIAKRFIIEMKYCIAIIEIYRIEYRLKIRVIGF